MNKLIVPCILCAATPVLGLEIKLDYTQDEAANQFFSSNPMAQQAVGKAANDLGSILTNSMTEVPTDFFSGTNGSTQANFDWSWNYTNPVNGSIETISNPTIAFDTIVVYTATRSLSGSTLAEAGAGGAGVQISGFGAPNQWIGAVDAAEANSNAIMSRGSGPVIGRISGAANFAGFVGQYDLDFGVSVGNMWFDADRDNNGTRDSDAALANSWHYDAYSPVAAGKTDLYSVALHEMMHVLGAGTSRTWNNLANGTQWLGSEASMVAGTSQILSSDGAHLQSGFQSIRISDGQLQEALLAPSITPGIRKELTEIDVAILTDLGYMVTVPEPSGVFLLGVAGILGLTMRTRR
ncbi:MAG: hypothetical protein AB8F34_13085 [Akkermansiaceae bacterium]